ncbi:unnamed protein product [Caenorhabditis auriculariae]|uniref:Uncharacterized protein n=1 Tax=Caenorhabditis auriculariae TaxID=2777116 RepID=A0A8S1H9K4_9PELO|nr:unnamed protein product [Caenorhabditis auriculariae]
MLNFSTIALFLAATAANSLIIPFSSLTNKLIFKNGSQLFVSSEEPLATLQKIVFYNSVENKTAWDISQSSAGKNGQISEKIGYILPDDSQLSITGVDIRRIDGFVYVIAPEDVSTSGTFHVYDVKSRAESFVMKDIVSTNVFFSTYKPTTDASIPAYSAVLSNFNYPSTTKISIYYGEPSAANEASRLLFDSSRNNGNTKIQSLTIPLGNFYVKTSGGLCSFDIRQDYNPVTKSSALTTMGALVSQNYPNTEVDAMETNEVSFENPNLLNVTITFNVLLKNLKSLKITLFGPSNSEIFSFTDTELPNNLDSNSTSAEVTRQFPIQRIRFDSLGPFAVQYNLEAPYASTTAEVITTTRSSSGTSLLTLFGSLSLLTLLK